MRRARFFWRIAAICLLVFPTAANAADERIAFSGEWIQGGLIIGRTVPASRITFGDAPVRVSADGWFVGGIGRDAPPAVTIGAIFPDGSRKSYRMAVARRTYDIQRIDGLPQRKVTPGESDLRWIRSDATRIRTVRKIDSPAPYFMSGFVLPVDGRVSGVFGSQRILNGEPRRPHRGVDIAAPEGTPVVACADGIVALTDPKMYFTGQTVMVDHGHGLTSVYAHLSAISVEEGDFVRKGEVIGRVGMSGRATGPHLHWGVTVFGTHVDPLKVTDLAIDELGTR